MMFAQQCLERCDIFDGEEIPGIAAQNFAATVSGRGDHGRACIERFQQHTPAAAGYVNTPRH